MLKQILQKYVDQPVKMVVYNSKCRNTRGQCVLVSFTSELVSCDLCGYHGIHVWISCDLYNILMAGVMLRISFPQM